MSGTCKVSILFHQHSEPADAVRRRALLKLLLESAARADATSNACASAFLADAKRWRHQMMRLVQMCLPHLLEPGAAAGAPTAELCAASSRLCRFARTNATIVAAATASAAD